MEDYYLGLNASEGRIQCLLATQDALTKRLVQRVFQEWEAPSHGAEVLVPMLSHLLALAGIAAKQITHIGVVRGPGSFTGVRLALGTGAGLARATGAALGGVDYFSLLAQSAISAFPASLLQLSTRVWVVTHARRNLVHVQQFCLSHDALLHGHGKMAEVCVCGDIAVVQVEELALLVNASEHVNVLVGSGVERNIAHLEQCLERKDTAVILPPFFSHPQGHVFLQALESADYTQRDVTPLYVRQSDAEDNLPHIAKQLHLDINDVHAALRSFDK